VIPLAWARCAAGKPDVAAFVLLESSRRTGTVFTGRTLFVATLAKLEEKKRQLEEKLLAGDLSVEPVLAQVDRAIAARTRQIQHSRKRVDAVKNAVQAGVPLEDTRKSKSATDAERIAKARAKRSLNRF
jgi:hypothetical protein